MVVELSRIGTIQDVSRFLHLTWDTVKDIQKRYLQRHYGNPDLSKLECIGIDEFAVAKGHVYKTIVLNLISGQVVYVGDGKGVNALDGIRRNVYREEKYLNKRNVLKGTRWLLLCNGKDVLDQKFKSRLDNALSLNEPLMKAYYLKESLKEIWTQVNKEKAEEVIENWLEQAYQAKIPKLATFANTLKAHRWGILAWYDYHISTAKLEGINNKVKAMKRQAYEYRDQKFFELKILAMHEKNYPFVG